MAQPTMKLSIIQRAAVRAIIQGTEGWDDYRKRKGINSAMLSGAVLFEAADALGVDVASAVKERNAGMAKATMPKFAADDSEGGMKPAVVDWQRIRNIAREEIALKLQPVIVERQIVITPKREIKAEEGAVTHEAFDKLIAATNVRDFSGNRINVYLYGPTGTGKTYAAAQLAKLMGLEFYFHSTAQEAYDLIGYEKVNGELAETDFVRAFEHGGVCLLDELDRYDAKAVTVVNAALANGRLVKPNGVKVTRHDDFICIGAGNTNMLGATADFTAAETMDKSTLSRFAVKLAWGVDPKLESKAAAERSQDAGCAIIWLEEIRAVRAALDRLGLPEVADQRAVEAGANLLAAGMAPDVVRDLTYLAGWTDDQREGIKNLVKDAARNTDRQIANAKKEA